jgi:hypothetical protein
MIIDAHRGVLATMAAGDDRDGFLAPCRGGCRIVRQRVDGV